MAVAGDMQSNGWQPNYGFVPEGAVPAPWPPHPWNPAMQQTMSYPFGGYAVPNTGWMTLMQGSFLPPTGEAAVGLPAGFQPTRPVHTADFMAQVHPMDQAGWADYSIAKPTNVGQWTQHQNNQRQRKKEGSERHGQRRTRKSSNVDDDEQSIISEDAEVVQAQIEKLADGLLREFRSDSVPRVQLAIAHFAQLTFKDKISTRAAQLALERASGTEQISMVSGLHGHVFGAMLSKHANYAIAKAVEVMPADRIGFIPQEILGHGAEVSRHRFGCRLICRILEHHSHKDATSMKLLDEVLEEAPNLCTHAFGSIVMRHFLEHGLPAHKHVVVTALRKDLTNCALQRKGSHVVEAVLRSCTGEDRDLIVQQLLGNAESLFQLATGQFSRHVILTLLTIDSEKGEMRQLAAVALLPLAPRLLTSKYAKNICNELGLRTTSQIPAQSPSRL